MSEQQNKALPTLPHDERLLTRRDLLLRGGGGFGALALSYLLGLDAAPRALAAAGSGNPLAAKPPRLPARAKSVIYLFMEGGPSHLDLLDRKPLLSQLAGKPLPSSFRPVVTSMGEGHSALLGSKRKWQQYGSGGLWFSDWLPNIATCADEIAVVHSCWGEGINHAGGLSLMNTGAVLFGRPSLGAWVSYGLGTENENLPAYVVLRDSPEGIVGGPRNWGPGFMPAIYQGTKFEDSARPIRDLAPPPGVGAARQRGKLDFLDSLNRRHLAGREESELEARIRSYELAFRMQADAPRAVDLAEETAETQHLYGLDDPATAHFGRNCLLARRLVERGVRFIQVYNGAGNKWDSHTAIERNHARQCRSMDQPVAGLLRDLKRRGLLDETLVVWGGEFGRTPMSEKGDGRDHNPYGFSMWLSGGGVPGGRTVGATDDLGLYAVSQRLHVRDLHATILHLLGVDHKQLVYLYKGRPERPTVNQGSVCQQLIEA